MSKPRYYAHTFGSKHDGSLRHVVMNRENDGSFWHLAPDAEAARELADKLNLSARYAAICDVIDRVKTDERSLDTDEYASMILAALEVSA